MLRAIVRVMVFVALAMTVDYLWLDHRLMDQLPFRAWIDRCSQVIERFGHSLVNG